MKLFGSKEKPKDVQVATPPKEVENKNNQSMSKPKVDVTAPVLPKTEESPKEKEKPKDNNAASFVSKLDPQHSKTPSSNSFTTVTRESDAVKVPATARRGDVTTVTEFDVP